MAEVFGVRPWEIGKLTDGEVADMVDHLHQIGRVK